MDKERVNFAQRHESWIPQSRSRGPFQAGTTEKRIFISDQLATHVAYIVSEAASWATEARARAKFHNRAWSASGGRVVNADPVKSGRIRGYGKLHARLSEKVRRAGKIFECRATEDGGKRVISGPGCRRLRRRS